MTKQEAINEAKYEVENPRLEILELCSQLRAAGAISDAETLEAIVARIEWWQNGQEPELTEEKERWRAEGEWIPIPEYENKRCSVCRKVFSDFTLGYYCPYCGAKMKGE